MEASKLLALTPEERAQRKIEWEQRQKLISEGRDPDFEKAQERAMKALILLRNHVNGIITLTDNQKIAYSGMVVNRSLNDFFFFCRYVLEMDLLTDKTHKRWCEDNQKAIRSSKKRVMRLKPRGTYKTTIYGLANILWLWGCFSPQIRIFYTSANALLLQEVSDKLNQYIGSDKNETVYSTIFGVVKDMSSKNTSDVVNISGRSGKGFSLILRTSGGSSVGIHPNICIVDDPLDANDRDSQTVRDGKIAWFDSLTPLLVPFHDTEHNVIFKTILYIGTRWHMCDLVDHILKVNEKLPEQQRWDIESESLCGDNFKSNYPDFISDAEVAEIRAGISDVFFACQYQNNPLPENMQLFNLKKLFFVRKDQVDIKVGQICCFFDPSQGKTSSDYPMSIWLHVHDDKITLIDAIDAKIELSLIVHQIAAKNKEYGCRQLVYEDNGVTLIGSHLKEAHYRINHNICIDPIHHSSNKHERICSIQPDLYSGRVQFMSDYNTRYPEFMNQLVFYPVYNHDDAPDVLEMGIAYFRQDHFKFTRYESCL
jgi:predicted phage terminase large subunit-like protein